MRILGACSLGGAGHLGPMVPVLAAAQRRGDDVVVIGPPSMGEMISRAGFTFLPGGEPEESVIAPIRELLPVVSREEATVLGNRELFGRLATTAMFPAMERTISTLRPDLVVRDPMEYASAVVAGRLAIPTAQIAISLADGEAASIAAASPALEEHRPGLTAELMASPYLTRFPASLDPPLFDNTFRYRDDEPVHPDDARSPTDWWDGASGRRLYVTFGTVLGRMTIAGEVLRTAIEAIRRVSAGDVSVLFTIGTTVDPAEIGTAPHNVRVEPWVPQLEALQGVDLVVCHGGSGTVFGALAAGRPLVCFPVFADQFENARRIEAAGAGLAVEPHPGGSASGRVTGDDDADRLAAAINTVLAGASYRRSAETVGAEMSAVGSAGSALDLAAEQAQLRRED